MAQRTIDFQSGFSVGTNRSRFLFFDNRRCHFDCGFSTSGFLGDDQTSGFDAHFGKMDSKLPMNIMVYMAMMRPRRRSGTMT